MLSSTKHLKGTTSKLVEPNALQKAAVDKLARLDGEREKEIDKLYNECINNSIQRKKSLRKSLNKFFGWIYTLRTDERYLETLVSEDDLDFLNYPGKKKFIDCRYDDYKDRVRKLIDFADIKGSEINLSLEDASLLDFP